MPRRVCNLTAVPCFPNVSLISRSMNWGLQALVIHLVDSVTNGLGSFSLLSFFLSLATLLFFSFFCSWLRLGQCSPDLNIFAFVAYIIRSKDGTAIWFVDLAWSTPCGMCVSEHDLWIVSYRVTHSIKRVRDMKWSELLKTWFGRGLFVTTKLHLFIFTKQLF